MDAGVHLPQLDLMGEGLSLGRARAAVAAAREAGFASVSANDHVVFRRSWLDGCTLLAAVLPEVGEMEVMTSVLVPALRGPAATAAVLATLEALSGGRLVAGLGAGSSPLDHEAVGLDWDGRWSELERCVVAVRSALAGGQPGLPPSPRPGGLPVWLASWGSAPGLRRVARLGDGWLASAYNTDPGRYADAVALLRAERARRGATELPHALVTMWTWVVDTDAQARQVLEDVLAPFLQRDPAALARQVCVGTPEQCARLLSRYAGAGCERVHFWPLGDEPTQLRRLATEVLPRVVRGSVDT